MLLHPPAEVGGRGVMLSKLGSTAAAAPAPLSIPGAACAADEQPESRGAAALVPVRMYPQHGSCLQRWSLPAAN